MIEEKIAQLKIEIELKELIKEKKSLNSKHPKDMDCQWEEIEK